MFLFLRLLLAHFIGDFPLQTGGIYHLKDKGGVGKWAHTIVIGIVSVLFVYPYWGYPSMWVYLVLSTLVHHLSDWVKVELNHKGSPRYFLLRYIADQIVHLATAAAVFLLPIAKLRLEISWPGWWANFYNSDFCMVYGCMLIVATYFTTYFIEAFKRSYRTDLLRDPLPDSYKYYGILERITLFLVAFLGNAYAFSVLIPLLAIRLGIGKRCWPSLSCAHPLEIGLGYAMGMLPGLALRFLYPCVAQ